MKVHMSLSTTDLTKTSQFYEVLFGEGPIKVKSDYLKFDPQKVPLNISFHLVDPSTKLNTSQHLGFQFASRGELEQAYSLLSKSGFVVEKKTESVCCYANQDKFLVEDPSGYRWELYTLLDDTEKKVDEGSTCCVGDDFEKKSKCC